MKPAEIVLEAWISFQNRASEYNDVDADLVRQFLRGIAGCEPWDWEQNTRWLEGYALAEQFMAGADSPDVAACRICSARPGVRWSGNKVLELHRLLLEELDRAGAGTQLAMVLRQAAEALVGFKQWKESFQVQCACGATGPRSAERGKAVEGWNQLHGRG